MGGKVGWTCSIQEYKLLNIGLFYDIKFEATSVALFVRFYVFRRGGVLFKSKVAMFISMGWGDFRSCQSWIIGMLSFYARSYASFIYLDILRGLVLDTIYLVYLVYQVKSALSREKRAGFTTKNRFNSQLLDCVTNVVERQSFFFFFFWGRWEVKSRQKLLVS